MIPPEINFAASRAGRDARTRRLRLFVAVAGALVALGSLAGEAGLPLPSTLGLPPVPIPRDNLQTPEKVALGRALFDDRRLSADGMVSCSTCHQPGHAFTDGQTVAKGVGQRAGTRNTPTLLNSVYFTSLFWDGRRESLEEQAADPLINPVEHGLGSHGELLATVRADAAYANGFRAAFGVAPESIRIEHVVKALAAFERTLVAGDSPFDRYLYGGEPSALSAAQVRGLGLFTGRARCAACHTIGEKHALLTDHEFHTIGIGQARVQSGLADRATRLVSLSPAERDQRITSDPEVAALGRFAVTLKPGDIGRFRTPTLRNVARTSPYMHDGSVPTLAEAVERELYYRGLEAGRPLVLTPQEKADLVAFLTALTSPEPALEPLTQGSSRH
ncbi:MAG TPA: cytochrome c peroxidase [Thermoanaerobaculia bacterium]|nr:cytochrome c peroxidase [Thermoanaerobaculia bacterium]